MNKIIFFKNQYINLLDSNIFIQNEKVNQTCDSEDVSISDDEVEYETSIRFKISEIIFTYYKEQFWDLIDTKKKEYVIYMSDDGYNLRIHSDKFQKKTEKERANFLIFMNNKFIPYTQTKSIESPAFKCIDFSKINTIVTRYTLLEYDENINDKPYDDDDIKYVRIVVESISNEKGVDYMFAAEVEYSNVSYENPNNLKVVNQTLFDLVSKILEPVWDSIDIKYDAIQPENVINIPSRIFHPIYKIDVNNYLIKYKFDGYKGKMIYTKKNFYYFDDLQKFKIIEVYPKVFEFFENIIFQFEIVSNVENTMNVLMLTDIIGVYINNTLYTLKPTDVLKVFSYISSISKSLDDITLNFRKDFNKPHSKYDDKNFENIDGYCLQIQKPILPTDKCSNLKYDGFIIISNELEIKYKIPTCDVRLFNYMLYIDNMNEPVTSEMFYGSEYKNNKIYEISINPKGFVYILRSRYDRFLTSTIAEYENFIEISKIMIDNKVLKK